MPGTVAELVTHLPEADTLVVAGKTFQIGPMTVEERFRITRLIMNVIGRVTELGARNAQRREQQVAHLPEETRAAALAALPPIDVDLWSLVRPGDLPELAAIALSSEQQRVDAAWAHAHWRLDWPFRAVRLWVARNQEELADFLMEIVALQQLDLAKALQRSVPPG
jgi:hypothetical protein